MAHVRADVRDFGLTTLVASRASRGILHARFAWRSLSRRPGRFSYGGRIYEELYRPYNRTWLNERAVELPVALSFIERFDAAARGLEIGNVLNHYMQLPLRVVDKYENAPGVENIDVMDVRSEDPFDFIVAISTLEHVGWDEPDRDIGKAARALLHLRSLLKPDGGRLLVTVPLGYHPALDVLALTDSGAEHQEFLVRNAAGRWNSVERPVPHHVRYLHEAQRAAAVWIAEFAAP